MSAIPITAPSQQVHINADRRLTFQVIAAMGTGGGPGDSANRVLERDGERMLVEFNSPVKLGPGIKTVFKTTEWVTMTEPEQITFKLVPGHGPLTGGLRDLDDRFVFKDHGGCTVLTYESRFAIRWSIFGWMVGRLWFSRYMKKHMIEHLAEVKTMVEARAERSRIYPQIACEHIINLSCRAPR